MPHDEIAADRLGPARRRPDAARRSPRRSARSSWPALVLLAATGFGCAPAGVIGSAEAPSSTGLATEPGAASTTAGTTSDPAAESAAEGRDDRRSATADPGDADRAPTRGADAIDAAATASEDATRVSMPVSAGTTTPTTTPYVVPVADPGLAGWNATHAAYPASDIFVAGGCGATIVSPVDGVLTEVRRVDSWSAAVDNPATRGGRSVTVVGNDGVRYYLAHFDTIGDAVVVGAAVLAGAPLGTVGDSGRAGACHVHFGISPPCPEREWSVRRGAIWPYRYLDAWADGNGSSPVEEIAAWLAANPDACAIAAADPHAQDG